MEMSRPKLFWGCVGERPETKLMEDTQEWLPHSTV